LNRAREDFYIFSELKEEFSLIHGNVLIPNVVSYP